jgi:hypothetical protein
MDRETKDVVAKAIRLPYNVPFYQDDDEETRRTTFDRETVEKIHQSRFESRLLRQATHHMTTIEPIEIEIEEVSDPYMDNKETCGTNNLIDPSDPTTLFIANPKSTLHKQSTYPSRATKEESQQLPMIPTTTGHYEAHTDGILPAGD